MLKVPLQIPITDSHLFPPSRDGTDLEEGLQRVVPEDGHSGHGYCLKAARSGAGRGSRGMDTRRRGRTAAQRASPPAPRLLAPRAV